jgi:DNA modification methylase
MKNWPPNIGINPYYVDEAVVIYHGDCREVLPKLPKVDCVLTDPPYGIGFGAKHTKWSANRGTVLGEWDATTPDIQWLIDAAPVVVVWGGERFALPVMRGWLAWIKPDAPPTFSGMELAWTNRDKPSRWIRHSISATNAERVGHPTQKPLVVMSWCIQTAASDAPVILDPFMGSGTTLRAAKDLGRKAIGIEIEEKYCEIAANRCVYPHSSMAPKGKGIQPGYDGFGL